jgi:hypothetical protein
MQQDEPQVGLPARSNNVNELPAALRAWIERVIVPILVKEYLSWQRLQKDEDHG